MSSFKLFHHRMARVLLLVVCLGAILLGLSPLAQAAGLGVATLISPVDGSAVANNTPTVQWSVVTGATFYRVQITDMPGQTGMIVVRHNPAATGTAWVVTPALPAGRYYWHVRACNVTTCGDWASFHSFIVPLPAPALISPADGATIADGKPTLTWASVGGAASYRMQVKRGSTSGSVVASLPLGYALTSWTASTALSAGTYYWHLRACDGSPTPLCGEWSAYRSFLVP